jgi:RNA polymerase sigma-70 factor (ECF subfamily)
MTTHRTRTDAALVTALRAGDELAFDEVVARHRAPLVRHARRMLPEANAEDVVQEALLRAHGSLRRGTEPVLLRPWLHRIVRNACLDELRRTTATAELPVSEVLGGGEDPLCHTMRQESLRELLADVRELPLRQREALVSHVVEGEPHAELAERLGISEGATKNLVNRARGALAAARQARAA